MPRKLLCEHPRLYVNQEAFARLKRPPALPMLQQAQAALEKAATRFAKMTPLRFPLGTHNAHLIRARDMQIRVVTLVTRWKQTGQERYRNAAVEYIKLMGQWPCWSWITWRKGDYRPDAIFDLSYGENSATLALAFDWLYDDLSSGERSLFLDIARERPFRSAMKHARPGAAWWFGKPDSNWNTVCAGGLGLLALAMYDELPQARQLLPRADVSVTPFIKSMDNTSGGWPEGIGYWNYGMRYAFMYLLSHERATGRRHPLLRCRGLRQTMSFPIEFCPHGEPCSFGDVNRWSPTSIHYAMAQRLGRCDVVRALDLRLHQLPQDPFAGAWPNAVEWRLLHPGKALRSKTDRGRSRAPVAKIYKGLDWGVLADRMPGPRLYVSVRGGTTNVPHGHRDLLSFHCVVNGERLITNISPDEYLDTTFSDRREELFEIGPPSKNTILINGVGVSSGSTLDRTELVTLPGARGIRLVATTAMGAMYDGLAARFCARLFLLLGDKALLIVDRAILTQSGRMESRIHTTADLSMKRSGALLRGKRERIRVGYASNVPCLLRTAVTSPTTPTSPPANVLRWCTREQLKDITMVSLLTPGTGAAKAALAHEDGRLVINVSTPSLRKVVTLTSKLRPARR